MKPLDGMIAIGNHPVFDDRSVPQAVVLEMLNYAVWAPNHMLREPWRFIFIDHQSQGKLPIDHVPAPAHLIVVMKNENSAHKRDEDLGAVFSLIQNFKLLAWEKKMGVKVSISEWMYDKEQCQKLGVKEKERIAAVLDLGFCLETTAVSPEVVPTLNWSLL